MDDPFAFASNPDTLAFNADTFDNLQDLRDNLNSSSSSSAIPEDAKLFDSGEIDNQNHFNIDNQAKKAEIFGTATPCDKIKTWFYFHFFMKIYEIEIC